MPTPMAKMTPAAPVMETMSSPPNPGGWSPGRGWGADQEVGAGESYDHLVHVQDKLTAGKSLACFPKIMPNGVPLLVASAALFQILKYINKTIYCPYYIYNLLCTGVIPEIEYAISKYVEDDPYAYNTHHFCSLYRD